MPETRKKLKLELRNRFSCLSFDDKEEGGSGKEGALVLGNNVENKWTGIRDAF